MLTSLTDDRPLPLSQVVRATVGITPTTPLPSTPPVSRFFPVATDRLCWRRHRCFSFNQVFLGVGTICAVCAVPVLGKNRPKPGHGLFDSEKPQEVELAQEEARRKKLNLGDRAS